MSHETESEFRDRMRAKAEDYYDRDGEAARVAQADIIRERLIEAARQAARELHAIGLLDLHNWRTPNFPFEPIEMIAIAGEEAEHVFNGLIDEAALACAARIAETGGDE